jgi:hypothetical protein
MGGMGGLGGIGGVGGGGGGVGGVGGNGGNGGGGPSRNTPCSSVTFSEADTCETLSNCAEHSNNAAARTRIPILKFIFTSLVIFIF